MPASHCRWMDREVLYDTNQRQHTEAKENYFQMDEKRRISRVYTYLVIFPIQGSLPGTNFFDGVLISSSDRHLGRTGFKAEKNQLWRLAFPCFFLDMIEPG